MGRELKLAFKFCFTHTLSWLYLFASVTSWKAWNFYWFAADKGSICTICCFCSRYILSHFKATARLCGDFLNENENPVINPALLPNNYFAQILWCCRNIFFVSNRKQPLAVGNDLSFFFSLNWTVFNSLNGA